MSSSFRSTQPHLKSGAAFVFLLASLVTLGSTQRASAQSGTLQFSAPIVNIGETAVGVGIVVQRTGGTAGAVSVTCDTQDGTAIGGTDYTPSSVTLSWADGDFVDKTFTIPILDRGVYDGSVRSFTVNLDSPVGATVGNTETTTVNIIEKQLATQPTSSPLATLYSFTAPDTFRRSVDGGQPRGPLIQGRDGNFYGTTSIGGAGGNGTVFQLSPSAQTLATLYSFTGVSPTTSTNPDGADPLAGVIQGTDGNLYGTTSRGGGGDSGTIFSLTLAGNLTPLYSFSALTSSNGGQINSDGARPQSGVVQGTDGNFYGTTFAGGADGYGTFFSLSGSTLTTLYNFTSGNPAGTQPNDGLIQASDGKFYGTTGTSAYRIGTDGSLTVLHQFLGRSDGISPLGGLVQGSDGNFYGTTSIGAPGNNSGTVFSLSRTGTLNTIYTFPSDGSDGAQPVGDLVQGGDGNFYGTTQSGGDFSEGTVFSVTPTGVLTTLYSFTGGADGSTPRAGLVQGTDGNFYGATSLGGPSAEGTIFRIGAQTLTQVDGLSFVAGESLPLTYTFSPRPPGDQITQVNFLANGVIYASVDGSGNPIGSAASQPGMTRKSSATAATVYGATFQMPAANQQISLLAQALSQLGHTQSSSPVTVQAVATTSDHPPAVTVNGISPVRVGTKATVPVTVTNPDGSPASAKRGPVARDVSAPSDGTVARMEYFLNALKVKDSAAMPFGFDFTPTSPGTYVITAIATDTAGLATASAPVTVDVLGVPTVAIGVKGSATITAGSKGKFVVSRDGTDLSTSLTVLYTEKGTAKNGADYQQLSGSLVIPAGKASAKIKILSTANDPQSGSLTVKIKLLPSTSGDYTVGTAKKAIIQINSNQ